MSGKWINPVSITSDYSNIKGKPETLVSDSSTDDGADFGPFTSGTSTAGIQEAINAIIAGTKPPRLHIKAGTYNITSPISAVYPHDSNGYCMPIVIYGDGVSTATGSTTPPVSGYGTYIVYGGTTAAPIMALGYNPPTNSPQAYASITQLALFGNGNETGGLVLVNTQTKLDQIKIIEQNTSTTMEFGLRIVGAGDVNSIRDVDVQIGSTAYSGFRAFHITGEDKYPSYTIGSTSVAVYGRPEGHGTGVEFAISASSSTITIYGIVIDDANSWAFVHPHFAFFNSSNQGTCIYINDPAANLNAQSYDFYGGYYEGDEYVANWTGSNAYGIFFGGSAGHSGGSGALTGSGTVNVAKYTNEW